MAQIKTYARLKPSKRAYAGYEIAKNVLTVHIPDNKDMLVGSHQHSSHSSYSYDITFTNIFKPAATQEDVFDGVAKGIIENFLNGYNGTIFAYGQTGTGKTYTVEGNTARYSTRGLSTRALSMIYQQLENRTEDHISVYLSYLEIYQEVAYDLLNPTSRSSLQAAPFAKVTVFEGPQDSCILRGLSLHLAASEEIAQMLLLQGQANRKVAETPVNQRSSRSHAVFTVYLQVRKQDSEVVLNSKLHLVDLAGSERVSKTGVDGQQLTEAKSINLSLHHLETVIIALQTDRCTSLSSNVGDDRSRRDNSVAQSKSNTSFMSGPSSDSGTRTTKFVPYRNSLLTMVLKDSLGISDHSRFRECLHMMKHRYLHCLFLVSQLVSSQKLQLSQNIAGRTSDTLLQVQPNNLQCDSGDYVVSEALQTDSTIVAEQRQPEFSNHGTLSMLESDKCFTNTDNQAGITCAAELPCRGDDNVSEQFLEKHLSEEHLSDHGSGLLSETHVGEEHLSHPVLQESDNVSGLLLETHLGEEHLSANVSGLLLEMHPGEKHLCPVSRMTASRAVNADEKHNIQQLGPRDELEFRDEMKKDILMQKLQAAESNLRLKLQDVEAQMADQHAYLTWLKYIHADTQQIAREQLKELHYVQHKAKYRDKLNKLLVKKARIMHALITKQVSSLTHEMSVEKSVTHFKLNQLSSNTEQISYSGKNLEKEQEKKSSEPNKEKPSLVFRNVDVREPEKQREPKHKLRESQHKINLTNMMETDYDKSERCQSLPVFGLQGFSSPNYHADPTTAHSKNSQNSPLLTHALSLVFEPQSVSHNIHL